MHGLQPPTTQQVRGFKPYSEEFLVIIISKVGCQDGTVSIYNTYTTLDTLTIQMMDVQRQCYGSDCGILAIAIAHDLCAGFDQGQVQYDQKKI